MRHHPLRALAPLSLALAISGALMSAPVGASAPAVKVGSGVLVSKAECAANRATGTITFVSPFGYDASAGIIDVVDAKQLGYFQQLCLTVALEVPSFSVSPYELVAAGQGTVTGEGSAADTMTGTAGGANLVAVATLGATSDYAIVTRPSITKLSQLNGKILGYHTVLPVVLAEMLRRGGASLSKITQVNDTSYDPSILFNTQPGYSALQAYQSNEPLTLAADGYRLGTGFREWTPAQFGVQGTFNVQVMNGSFLRRHPTAAADFLRAELHALDFCLGHETTCVTLEQGVAKAAGYSSNLSHALAEWKIEAGLIRKSALPGRGIGVQTASEWASEARAALSYGLVAHAPVLSRIENTTLAAGLYHGTTLIWP